MSAARFSHTSGKEEAIMSRIGRMPIKVPAGVEVKNDNNIVTVKGPKGELTKQFSNELGIEVADGVINVTRPSDDKAHRSLHGLTRTLIANMVEGVTNGYSKTLENSRVSATVQPRAATRLLLTSVTHILLLSRKQMLSSLMFLSPTR